MRPIHVIAVGAFGERVAERMAEFTQVAVTTPTADNQTFPSEWPLAVVHVVASWRPVPRLAALVDNLAFNWRIPWLPVVCDHPYLLLGPAVIPGKGACHTCFRRRMLQHSRNAALAERLNDHYDAQPDSGPRGFLQGFASFAATAALEVIEKILREPEEQAGLVRQLHMLSLKSLQAGVVGFHGCPRCGLHRDERTRSYAQLLPRVAELHGAESQGR